MVFEHQPRSTERPVFVSKTVFMRLAYASVADPDFFSIFSGVLEG